MARNQCSQSLPAITPPRVRLPALLLAHPGPCGRAALLAGFTVEVRGDFHGRGARSFERRGDWGHTTYDGRVRVTKPLIRFGSFLLKPLFASSHSWVMRRGPENFRAPPRRAAAGSATVWYPPA